MEIEVYEVSRRHFGGQERRTIAARRKKDHGHRPAASFLSNVIFRFSDCGGGGFDGGGDGME